MPIVRESGIQRKYNELMSGVHFMDFKPNYSFLSKDIVLHIPVSGGDENTPVKIRKEDSWSLFSSQSMDNVAEQEEVCEECDGTGEVVSDAFDEEGRVMRGAGEVKDCKCIY